MYIVHHHVKVRILFLKLKTSSVLSQPTLRWEGEARLEGVSSKKGERAGVATNVYLGKMLKKPKGVCEF